MADVRSLLRQERASRQQTGRPQKQSAAPAAAPSSKKRKAADDGAEERKRTRTEEEKGVPAGFFDGGVTEQSDAVTPSVPDEQLVKPTRTPIGGGEKHYPDSYPHKISDNRNPRVAPADDEELDAFIKEIDEAPQPRHTLAAYTSAAVVEAAPMTAAELAAQAREEQSAQRGRREEEMEADKEDAERQLEDEFEEMEGLEERVRKLREKREALRQAHVQPIMVDAVPPPLPAADEDQGSESEDEEWDDWRFRLA